MLRWFLPGFTLVLLLCEMVLSELSSSTIILVDSFHTLFILMRICLRTALPSVGSSPSPSPSPPTLPAEPPTTGQPGSCGSNDPEAQEGARSLSSGCGVSYSRGRIRPVGEFISSLTLSSLSVSYLLNLISISMEPKPLQRPVLLVLLTSVTLLHKMLVLWFYWDELQQETPNHTVSAAGDSKRLSEPGRVLGDAPDKSLHNGTLVLYNSGATRIPGLDSPTSQTRRPRFHLHGPDFNSQSNTLMSEDVGHLDQKESPQSSSAHTGSPEGSVRCPVWLPWLLLVFEGVFTSVLAVTVSAASLLVEPQCRLSSADCVLLTNVNVGLSLTAVVVLVVMMLPQLHKYGLMLLQAAPPHLCVSDLEQRIAGVPGVQAVHEFHIWQLTQSFLVATVHVQCHAWFPVQRCGDLMLEVTKVLRSEGVCCCTVQPEFVSCSEGCAPSPPPPPPLPPPPPPPPSCSLSCAEACSGSMCCRSLEEQSCSATAPPAGETKEDHQTLQSVIENTFQCTKEPTGSQ